MPKKISMTPRPTTSKGSTGKIRETFGDDEVTASPSRRAKARAAGIQETLIVESGMAQSFIALTRDFSEKKANQLRGLIDKETVAVQDRLLSYQAQGLDAQAERLSYYYNELTKLFYRGSTATTTEIKTELIPTLESFATDIQTAKSGLTPQEAKPLFGLIGKIRKSFQERLTPASRLKSKVQGLLGSELGQVMLAGAISSSPLLMLGVLAFRSRQRKKKQVEIQEELRQQEMARQRRRGPTKTFGGDVANARAQRQITGEPYAQKNRVTASRLERRKAKAASRAKMSGASGDAISGIGTSSDTTGTTGTPTSSDIDSTDSGSASVAGTIPTVPTVPSAPAAPATDEPPLLFGPSGEPLKTTSRVSAAAPAATQVAGAPELGEILKVVSSHSIYLKQLVGISGKQLQLEQKRDERDAQQAEEKAFESQGSKELPGVAGAAGGEEKEDKGGGILGLVTSLIGARIPGLGKLGGLLGKGGRGIVSAGAQGLGSVATRLGATRLGGAAIKGAGRLTSLAARASGAGIGLLTAGKSAIASTASSAASFGTQAAKKLSSKALTAIGKAKGGLATGARNIIGKLVKKKAPLAVGKLFGKSVPILGAVIGAGFALGKLLKGDFVGAGLEFASGLGGPLTAIPLTIASLGRDIYQETYGVNPETDPDVGARMSEVKSEVTTGVIDEVNKLGDKGKQQNQQQEKKETATAVSGGDAAPPSAPPSATPAPMQGGGGGGGTATPTSEATSTPQTFQAKGGAAAAAKITSSGSAAGGSAPSGGAVPSATKESDEKPRLAQVRTKSGKTTQVNALYVKNFQGFINDLESTGYVIRSIGGYVDRPNRNNPKVKSYHALGASIDINPDTNPNQSTKTDLPPETAALAAKWGLGWGMNWKSVKDPMHFSIAKGEGGSVDLRRSTMAAPGPDTAPAATGGGGTFGGGRSGGGGGGADFSGGATTASPARESTPSTPGASLASFATPSITTPTAPTSASETTPTAGSGGDATQIGRQEIASSIQAPPTMPPMPQLAIGAPTTNVMGGGGGGGGTPTSDRLPAPIDMEPVIRRVIHAT